MDFGKLRSRNVCLVVHMAFDRADYLDRGFTPHLLDISKQGLRAKFMRPVFPVGTLAVIVLRDANIFRSRR